MTEFLVLRVNAAGQVTCGNAEAEQLMDREGTRSCHRLVGAQDPRGAPICTSSCAANLAQGRTPGNQDCPSVVRGKATRLHCQRAGDEVVVVMQRSETNAPKSREQLTPREREVLGLVAQGLTTKQAAQTLSLKPCTVRTHVEHACGRLGVKNRAEAVRQAIATGQLEIS